MNIPNTATFVYLSVWYIHMSRLIECIYFFVHAYLYNECGLG